MTAERGVRERVRHRSAWLLSVAGDLAIGASRRIAESDGATLVGDRWIEWSFCLARLVDGPGTTLDFGADVGFLSLAAAQRGHDVVALDRMPPALEYRHPRVIPVQGDILDRPLEGRRFDQIINCSSVEHVGLAGRYGSLEEPNGDLEAMAIMRELLNADGRMIMTVPVGRDLVCAPLHRIYGHERLPRLLEGYAVQEAHYWLREPAASAWTQVDKEDALQTRGSEWFYALGLMVLGRAGT
jgi:2-polyprenyl-3-methyl-5-hydroxy-6-metoxy-1,4-benzoquinol methylase